MSKIRIPKTNLKECIKIHESLIGSTKQTGNTPISCLSKFCCQWKTVDFFYYLHSSAPPYTDTPRKRERENLLVPVRWMRWRPSRVHLLLTLFALRRNWYDFESIVWQINGSNILLTHFSIEKFQRVTFSFFFFTGRTDGIADCMSPSSKKRGRELEHR